MSKEKEFLVRDLTIDDEYDTISATASVQDAATAVEDCKAEIAIPIHYGMYEGTDSDIVTLNEILTPKNVEVVVLAKN